MFYVYQYEKKDGTPSYIGKGSGNRINEVHLPHITVPPAERRIILHNGLTEKEAFDLEYSLIEKYGRKHKGGILENVKLTRWVSQAGWNHSTEAKQKISVSNSGKVRTEAHKKNYRQPKTDIHAENIKTAVSELWADPKYKEKD